MMIDSMNIKWSFSIDQILVSNELRNFFYILYYESVISLIDDIEK